MADDGPADRPAKRRFGRKGRPDPHPGGTGPRDAGMSSDGRGDALHPPSPDARDDERGRPASPETAPREGPPTRARRLDAVRQGVRRSGGAAVRRSGEAAKATLGFVADRLIEYAPRIPVRDLTTLRAQFPGLGPEQIADKLVAGAAKGTSTVGAGIGAAAMLPVPPALPAELATEIIGVAVIELKLIAELHEVYGRRPPGNLGERSAAYLGSWSEERGIDVSDPATINAALGGRMKRELRQQIMKRTVRNLPNLMPFMIGAAVGAVMNRRDTRKLAERIRKDLRARQVPWDELPPQPRLEQPGELPHTIPVELRRELDR
ncbi:hypothetical protein [Streptomyces tirandamycinicus]|uniref:EcsC family protein n=1 Tax=Streptomyces tirandamycinicus TaxID=2174846 RepID=A0A2S1SYF7_9ACTN|nr:hypothetical protein [Streptomyces tirandamycinicus]AWI31429.1 hypothetical protein DDW44_23605 [Streptomyces tirandamycinicus]